MEPVEVLVTPTPTGGHLETGTPRSTTSSEQELAAITHSPLSTQVISPMAVNNLGGGGTSSEQELAAITHSLLSTQVLSPMAVSNWGGGSLLIFESVVIINHACA